MKEKKTYYALFTVADEGGYTVSFPELPGCVTFGKDIEQATEKAQEVLSLWLEELSQSPSKNQSLISQYFIQPISLSV
jgi:predicted RNase H-like HicB family nuclease